jgi:D-serine deaminase-like pyridoxal phosphate-dependent protein
MPHRNVQAGLMNRSIDDKPVTPYLRLDIERMERNIRTLQSRLDRLGIALRPHVKTCKSIEVARRMLGQSNTGITVSTLAESAWFLDHDIRDQIYAVGIAPSKLQAVADLERRGARLRIVLDHPATARRVVEAAATMDHRFEVLLEIDADGRRAGFAPGDPGLVEAAGILTAGGCAVAGVMTHMGGSYACADRAALKRAAERERAAAVKAADALRAAGFDCEIVSVGSTPTARFAADLDGVTEVRAGTHVFMDLVMTGLGVCTTDDIAISVVCEIIGYREHAGEWLVDAGWMALSADRGTADQRVDFGYGRVAGDSTDDDLIVRSASQEHGVIARRDGARLGADAFEIGQRIAVLPNHACATAAQHDRYRVEGGRDRAPEWWSRIRGW